MGFIRFNAYVTISITITCFIVCNLLPKVEPYDGDLNTGRLVFGTGMHDTLLVAKCTDRDLNTGRLVLASYKS